MWNYIEIRVRKSHLFTTMGLTEKLQNREKARLRRKAHRVTGQKDVRPGPDIYLVRFFMTYRYL